MQYANVQLPNLGPWFMAWKDFEYKFEFATKIKIEKTSEQY